MLTARGFTTFKEAIADKKVRYVVSYHDFGVCTEWYYVPFTNRREAHAYARGRFEAEVYDRYRNNLTNPGED